MKTNYVKEMVMSGLLITIGIVFPIMFHFFGLGKSFLPMHIPVLLAGFILSTPYAVSVGVITPILSSLITGMPPMYPVLPYMVFELAMYALAANIFSQKMKLNSYFSLILSMIAGRLTAGIVVWIMIAFLGAKLSSPLAFIVSAITTGVPGIIIQVVFIPPIIMILRKMKLTGNEALRV